MRGSILALALLPLAAAAQPMGPSIPPGYELPSNEDGPAQEQNAVLPAYPKAENLVRIDTGPESRFEFFVDLASVSVDKDLVVRFTLLARSSGGGVNVSFEGISCDRREYKRYAFGRSDDSWSWARQSNWAPISGIEANRQHAVLADEYFCPGRSMVKNTAEALAALKHGGHPRGDPGGDTQTWSQWR